MRCAWVWLRGWLYRRQFLLCCHVCACECACVRVCARVRVCACARKVDWLGESAKVREVFYLLRLNPTRIKKRKFDLEISAQQRLTLSDVVTDNISIYDNNIWSVTVCHFIFNNLWKPLLWNQLTVRCIIRQSQPTWALLDYSRARKEGNVHSIWNKGEKVRKSERETDGDRRRVIAFSLRLIRNGKKMRFR